MASLQLGLTGGRGVEPLDAAGRLDLLADLWTAETPCRGTHELEATLDRLGGTLTPWVDLDGLGWRLDFLSARSGGAFALAEELLAPPRLSPRTVQEVRRAVRSTLGGREADAGTVASQAARSRLFAGHPWSLPPWGSIPTMAELRPAELLAAWHHHARAGGAVLSLSGDLDPEAALDALEALAERLPAGPPAAAPPLPEPTASHLQATVPRGRGHVVITYPGLAAGDPDLPALEVLVTLLGAQSGPLFQEVRERRGLAYDVDASHTEGRLGGALEVRASTDPLRLERLLAALAATLDGVSNLLDDEAVRAAARLAAGRRTLDRQLCAVRAEERALSVVQGEPWDSGDRAPARLADVDPARVRAVAARIIVPDRRIESLVGPAGGETEA